MAEVAQEASIKADADPFGYGVEEAKVPVEGAAIPAGDDATNPQMFDVDTTGMSISETPVGEQQAESVESSQEQSSAKEDPSRFEYWQSQADKVKGELSATQQELAYYREQAMQSAQQSPSNGQPVEQAQETSLKPPVKPEKPVNYNEVDAYNDPESASFKFRMQKEQYQDDYLSYMETKDANREAEYAKRYQQAMLEQEANSLRSNAYNHVVSNYGWDQSRANDFVQWASNPANVTVDHLAKLFQMKDAPNAQVEQRKNQVIKEREIAAMPRSAAVETGKTEPPMTDEDLFNAGLMALKR
tara:strand:+ start:2371 stop:3273 length:903 start_codon:yes stop_codon:yes gene_type:complete